MSERPISRRSVLQLTGAAAAGTTMTGLAAAGRGEGGAGEGKGKEKVRVNVGYAGKGGRQRAEEAAEKVIHRHSIDVVTIEVPRNALRGLRRRSDVRFVEEDIELEALAQQTPYGIDRVDAEQAHAAGERGDGADIAIIDTGIDDGHPDLEANLGEGRAFLLGIGTGAWNDDNGHGSHCAGTADAVDNSEGVVGVSTDATLHAVKVLNAAGSGFTSDIAAGIEYTADQGWDVGSLSLGGGGSSTLREACQYATEKGTLLVAAAGNDGPCTDCVGFPAAYPEVMAVSATNSDDGLADFSSTGPEVEIAAPGANVYSTYLNGGYSTLSGTSMACPHVSGAAGQLMANGLTNDEARSRLKSTAEDIGLADNESGAGLLDAAAAVGVDSSDDL